eukprot:980010-Pelagomonas_calceolata.AAC.1
MTRLPGVIRFQPMDLLAAQLLLNLICSGLHQTTMLRNIHRRAFRDPKHCKWLLPYFATLHAHCLTALSNSSFCN